MELILTILLVFGVLVFLSPLKRQRAGGASVGWSAARSVAIFGWGGGEVSAFAPPPRPHPPPPLPGRATHSSGGRGSPGQARRGLGGAHRHAPLAPPTEEVTPAQRRGRQ